MPGKTDKEVVDKLVGKFRGSLENEKSVDIDEMTTLLSSLPPKRLAARGLAVVNLVIGSMRTGLGGKTIIELELDPAVANGSPILDTGDIRTGDIVKVTQDKAREDSPFIEGVVVKSGSASIAVAIDEKFENTELQGRLWMAKLANSITYKRMEDTLADLTGMEGNLTKLHRILLGQETPVLEEREVTKFFDETLNDSQKSAVKFSLGSDVSVVHGPPGTGKTYTVVEIIRQLVSEGKRVLVCGPSNISVDNILERLHSHVKGDKLIRVGHPARLLQSNLIHSLDIVSKTSNQGQVIRDIRQEIDQHLKKVSKTKSGRERRAIYADVKDLRKDYRQREREVLINIILQAQVVVSTLHGSGSRCIRNAYTQTGGKLFDAIIIDEVSQALEPQCWIPLTAYPHTPKLIIAGDNKQLPPTIKTKSDKFKMVLQSTLFDRLVKLYGEKIKRLLNVQYRMNTQIMDFPAKAMYEGKLMAADSVANRTLCTDIENVETTDETETPVLWMDTQGDDFPESQSEDEFETSRFNVNEASLVKLYVEKLFNAGLKESDIGVITPYSAQTILIKGLLESYPGVEVSTVDGFQGREKNAIIMSLVRSNDKREVGFLSDDRRLNVAMTRPRMHLCVIGNMECISSDKFMKSWVDWAEENTQLEYPDVSDVL
jgi:DNA polymerase alpha-associated DNA helicase A